MTMTAGNPRYMMAYVNIKEESEDKLHLVREPATRSWAIFIGLISLGLGAAYYSGDYLFWKIAYVSGTVFVGLTCMEDWEECILDKTTNKVTIKKISLIQKLFQTEQGQKIVVGDLLDCISVSIEKEEVAYAGTGYIVALRFGAGYSLGVTETTNVGDKSDQEYIADKISNFLGLDKVESQTSATLVEAVSESEITMESQEAGAAAAMETGSTNPLETPTGGCTAAEILADNASSSSSSTEESDDSFEQIDREELVNMNETAPETVNDEEIPINRNKTQGNED